MSSVEIYIVVEGQTEQTFVRDVLAPTIVHKGIYLFPILIGKPGHKGGNVNFDRAKNDIGNFLKQRNDTYVTTMFDYFRIDSKWPGREDVERITTNGTNLTTIDKANTLEIATQSKITAAFPNYNSENRFIPYIEMHEFEALLFSDANILAEKTEIDLSKIEEILDEHGTPEEINDDPQKAPSKQLEALKSDYRKVVMGKTISEAIGIEKIRVQCPHFNEWLVKLEQLA